MIKRWGALPLGEEPSETPGRCVNCGGYSAPHYDHCDDCLILAVRGMCAVDRAVKLGKAA